LSVAHAVLLILVPSFPRELALDHGGGNRRASSRGRADSRRRINPLLDGIEIIDLARMYSQWSGGSR
jgi:hypothetical protein